MDAIFAPFTPMFELFPSLYRIHASIPTRKQAHSTAYPLGLPVHKTPTTGSFVIRKQGTKTRFYNFFHQTQFLAGMQSHRSLFE